MKKSAILVVVGLILAVSGCSSHPRRVDCEAHLQPINTPTPVKGPQS